MKTFDYKYSILKYYHSPSLGECINIGILIYFTHSNEFTFIYSKKLNRIRSIYDNVSEKLIKYYLKEIDQKTQKLNSKAYNNQNQLNFKLNFDEIILESLLPKDGSSLQFSKVFNNFQLGNSNTKISKFLYQKFLLEKDYKTDLNKDYFLAKKFYNNLKSKLGEKIDNDKFKKNVHVRNETGVEFKFNYAWINGKTNLVKPLNFDLSSSKNISDKAHKSYGLVIDLEQIAKTQNYSFNFIVGKPKSNEFLREYNHSISLLKRLEIINIVEEDEIDGYTDEAIQYISK
ncbi:DUF3037 domain-containing protein [Mesonia aestuariivivens]|uniref:DUF3037 domain-containing protein n=1 Tax=Mesonia aestuariivivens TaxID=2796128 RepID=A0ABS6W5B4_9FLAO|nr:DUF3037 domain-containing protein [Mesonia aestuariivivens]MBW2962899.1 DUF3037 domain-containing protein [Mesonia aestuariivivens]